MSQVLAKNLATGAQAVLFNNTYIKARNAANSADVNIIKLNASDIIEFASLPRATGTPSNAADLVTKAYADSITGTGANTALSNLASVAINADLVADSDNDTKLGSATFRWSQAFITSLRDASSNVVMNVTSRTLNDSAGTAAIDFSSTTDITSSKNILPTADNTKNIGSGAARFAQAFIGLLKDASSVNAVSITGRLLVNAAGNTVLDFSGTNLDVNTRKILNVVDPTSAQDAATKAYVDSVASAQKTWFVDALTLSGTNITNQNVTLSQTPISASASVYFNGVYQRPGTDWTVSGTTLSFAGDLATGGASALIAGDVLYVHYQY